MRKGEKMSEDQKRKIIYTRTKNGSYFVSNETRKKISDAVKGEKHRLYGKHHTFETKKKLSVQKIGSKNPQFGKHKTEKQKDVLRLKNTGRKHTLEAKKKISDGLKGKKFSESRKKSLSISHIGQKPWNLHLKNPYSKETLKKMSNSKLGKVPYVMTTAIRKRMSDARKRKKAWNWKGGTSSKNRIIRRSLQFKLWREAVFKRDNWTCRKTNKKGGVLHPHHILNFSQYPELRFDVNNGITLSEQSHREFHKRYGLLNNSKEQIEEFIACTKITQGI